MEFQFEGVLTIHHVSLWSTLKINQERNGKLLNTQWKVSFLYSCMHIFKECDLCSFVLGAGRHWGTGHSPSLHILSLLTGRGDQY